MILLAVRLYYRFTLSLRDVEEMLAERGIDVSYETIRCWANKSDPPSQPVEIPERISGFARTGHGTTVLSF